MIKKIFRVSAQVCTVALLSIPTIVVNSTQPSRAANTNFSCQVLGGVHTTFLIPPDGIKTAIVGWTSQFGGLSSKQRCLAVSRNFQKNSDNKTLSLIIDGTINRQPVICGAVTPTDGCTKETLLFTLKPGSNPKEVIRSLFYKRGLRSAEINNQAGDDSRVVIDFNAYLNGLRTKR